ncbi:sporulation phosphorelay system protein KapB [Halalkalibacter kiskunsagensis]|uniref:Sporulation phosphorelay system protein KapB n=1 Tax=Halalkalibacter kiskunsagensis TaxID=1548599 RepID=A0ABV6KA79_9BACI
MEETQYVRAFYKTGVYIAELLDKQEENGRVLVKVVAVLKHPMQGDLHNPKMVNVAYFHQRKALAEFEKTWVPLSSIKTYTEPIPQYKLSLQKAVEAQMVALQEEGSEWAQECIEKLKECKREYGL